MSQKVYPIHYKAQNYAWGQPAKDSLVFELYQKAGLAQQNDQEKEFAELWLGDHPNGPSEVQVYNTEKTIPLRTLIEEDPQKYLGKGFKDNQAKLPFLFKVLSIQKPLSLQVHPNKSQAQVLHENHSNIYKDDNHKPEMSIALTDFEAFFKFKPYESIVDVINSVPAFVAAVGKDRCEAFKNCKDEDKKDQLRGLLQALFERDKTAIRELVEAYIKEISSKEQNNELEQIALRVHKYFPYDIGIFMCMLLNYIKLKAGDAIIIDPQEPHGYISGNIIECMATSDNVIRGCFTPKYIDQETLCQVISTKMGTPQIYHGQKVSEGEGYQTLHFQTPYWEFTCYQVEFTKIEAETNELQFNHPSVALTCDGDSSIIIMKDGQNSEISKLSKGQACYILPGTKFKFISNSEKATVYVCRSQDL